jgi:hypothetical protein
MFLMECNGSVSHDVLEIITNQHRSTSIYMSKDVKRKLTEPIQYHRFNLNSQKATEVSFLKLFEFTCKNSL